MIEAMKKALEALEWRFSNADAAIEALRQAIEQAVLEERKACWKLCERYAKDMLQRGSEFSYFALTGVADTIKARGNKMNELDIADRAYFAGKQDGIDETIAQPTKFWVGLDENDFEYQPPQTVITMKFAEAILRDRNK